VYVTGGGNPDTALQKFTNNGTSITSWGSTGLEDGQFISPGWITVDSHDNVYVGDFGENYRIQKFDSNGNFITKWGTPGTGDGQFEEPTGIAIDSLGNVYVVDRGNSRVQVFALQ
jgi:DNA-binding beta-propeller fold protein YncE